jgi:CheY-like chemotaxis protein
MSAEQDRNVPATVLVVDDDPDFRESLGAFLKANGLRVVEAGDGREAFRVAMSERPQVIIMDIIMNERTEGLFTLQNIRRTPELRETPVIVVSSLYSDVTSFSVSPERAWMAQNEFFAKPLDMPRLLDTIRAFAEAAPDGR